MSVYESITAGLNEAIEYENGNKNITAKKVKCTVNPVTVFSPDEIKCLRAELHVSQSTFALIMGVSQKTVEAWEKGTNKPIGSSCRLMNMLKKDPLIPQKYNIVSN